MDQGVRDVRTARWRRRSRSVSCGERSGHRGEVAGVIVRYTWLWCVVPWLTGVGMPVYAVAGS